MDKKEFLHKLQKGLSGLPKDDIQERLSFYSEMIDDSIEEGLTEEEAISRIGSVDNIIRQIIDETPLSTLAKQRIKPKKELSAVEITLLVLGCPIWLSLLISFFAVILSLYVSLWAVVISLWSVFAAFVASALGVLIGGIAFGIIGYGTTCAAMIAACFVCSGLAILSFLGCKALTKGAALLTKGVVLWTKNRLMRKEAAQ